MEGYESGTVGRGYGWAMFDLCRRMVSLSHFGNSLVLYGLCLTEGTFM